MCRYLLKATHETLDIKAQGSERSGPKRSAEFWAYRKGFYRVQQLLASARRAERGHQGGLLPWDFDLNHDVLPPGWEYVYTEQERAREQVQDQETEQGRNGRQGAAPDKGHTHHSSSTSFMISEEGGGKGGEEGGLGAPCRKKSRPG